MGARQHKEGEATPKPEEPSVKFEDKTSNRPSEVIDTEEKRVEDSSGNEPAGKKQDIFSASDMIARFEKMRKESLNGNSLRGMGNKYRSEPPIKLFDFSYEEARLERERKSKSEALEEEDKQVANKKQLSGNKAPQKNRAARVKKKRLARNNITYNIIIITENEHNKCCVLS